MDRLLLVCCCLSVSPVFSLYQTYDYRALGHPGFSQRSYAPTYRQAQKPRYDYVSRPSFDYSITYGYQPTVKANPPSAKSSFVSAYSPYQAQTYPPPSYSPSYTVSTGSYNTPKQGYHVAGHYGYQTRNTFPYPPVVSHGGVQRYGREGDDGDSYEYTSYEDFADAAADRKPVVVTGYKTERGYDFGMENEEVSSSSREFVRSPGIVNDDGILDRVDSIERTAGESLVVI